MSACTTTHELSHELIMPRFVFLSLLATFAGALRSCTRWNSSSPLDRCRRAEKSQSLGKHALRSRTHRVYLVPTAQTIVSSSLVYRSVASTTLLLSSSLLSAPVASVEGTLPSAVRFEGCCGEEGKWRSEVEGSRCQSRCARHRALESVRYSLTSR